MDLEDVQSDLRALKKLYGLLQNSGEGLQNANSKNLDEKARGLLKNLLDCATARAFETRSKIIAAQSGGLNTPPTELERPRGISRSKPPVPPNTLKIRQGVVQNLNKDLNCPEPSQKEHSSTKSIPHEMVLEQSRVSFFASEPENRKKVCGLHKQSSVKPQSLAQKTQISNGKSTKHVNNRVPFSHFSASDGEAKGLNYEEKCAEPFRGHEKPRQKRNWEVLQRDPMNTELLAASSRTLTSGVECSLGTETQKKLEDLDCMSKEVADTIKQIESCLPDGNKSTAQQGPCKKKFNSIPHTDSDSPEVIERKKGLVLMAELSQTGQDDLPSQQGIQRLRKPSDSSMQHLVMSPSHKSTSEGIDFLDLNKDEPKLPDWDGIGTLKPLQKSNSQLNRLVIQKGGQCKGSNFPANMLNPDWSPNMGPQSQKTTRVPGQDVKPVIEKFELVNRLASQNNPVASPVSDTIQGFRIPSRKDIVKEAPSPVKVLNQIHKENRDRNLMSQRENVRKEVKSRSSVISRSVGADKQIQAAHADQKLIRPGNRKMIMKEKNLPAQMVVRPTLLNHCPSQKSFLPSASSYTDQTEDIKGSEKQKHTYASPHRRIMQPHHQRSEETNSNSCSSSSWTTQQTSSTCSDSESKGPPLPGQAPLQLRKLGHDTHSRSSSKDCSNGILPQYEHQDSSRSMTGIRKYRSGYRVKSQKSVGRLKRLKNKLAIIFHHHHHHHHHHNDESEETEVGYSQSLQKYVQNMFHPRSKEEACEEEAVEKFKSSAIINTPSKQQGGRHHLHAMVEGLMRHIRNSKKSKAGKGGIDLVVNGQQHGNKKMGKKLHWWQSSGSHGGMKLPNKGRIKVGFRSKKPQLRAGKKK